MKLKKFFNRTIVSILLVLQIHQYSFAQSQDWKQLGSPFKTTMSYDYQSSHGYLFGIMSLTNQSYFSYDNGDNWIFLPDRLFYRTNSFREDQFKNIYFSNDTGIYHFDPVTLTTYLKVEGEVLDFAILENGNFVVANMWGLAIFDPAGIKIHERSIFSGSIQLLIDADGQNHFLIRTLFNSIQYIMEFNDDLSYLSAETRINDFDQTRRNGDRLFKKNTYSDNGVDWIPNQFVGYVSLISIGQDGTVMYATISRLFISNDNGETFQERVLPFVGPDRVSSDANGIILASQSDNGNFYRSSDSGITWEYIEASNAKPYLGNCLFGTEGNLFYMDYFNRVYYKVNESLPWMIDTIQIPNARLSYPVILSNGSKLAFSDQNTLYEIKENGKSWSVHSDLTMYPPVGGHGIVEKSDGLYNWYGSHLYHSIDFGKTWTKLEGISRPTWGYAHVTQYGVYNFEHYLAGIPHILYYNFLTHERIEHPRQNNQYTFATSFYGDDIYALQNDSSELYLCVSYDKGKTFTKKLIEGIMLQFNQLYSLRIDHLNNIYVYNDKSLFYSSNNGLTWRNITPDFPELFKIHEVGVSYDNYIYLLTVGMGVLKYEIQLNPPRKLIVSAVEDQNNNCIADSDETSINNVKVLLNGNDLKQANTNGETTFYTQSVNNEVKIIYNDKIYMDCDSSYTIEFEDHDTLLHIKIPLKIRQYCADPVVGLSVPFLRRCFDNTYSGSVCNEGNIESINTEIEILLDPFFDFISSNLPVKSINGQTLILDGGHLQPGECLNFILVVNINCNAGLGQHHCISAYSRTGSAECGNTTSRSAYIECQENIGAYDPNDKTIYINGKLHQSYIKPEDKIEYLIRFQNTGSDTAFTVRIEDPIMDKFDISSLKPVAASHPYTWSINNRTLIVLFEDIQLVDSFKNEPASHGFIKFEIQLDSLTIPGDYVKNLAGIFFDFNQPIITDPVYSIISEPLSIKEHSFESLTAFPNPANGLVYISGNALSDKPQDLKIYDIHGRLILSQKISHHDNWIDISKCTPGTYMLLMKSGDKVYRGKVLKM